MSTALAVTTTTVVGLMVGVEFAVAFVLNPILARLPAGASLAARADGGRVLGRAMPFWYVASLLLSLALVVLTWGSPAATVALAAAALLALSVVASVTLLVPINDRSKNWTEHDHPEDWREQHRRWDRLHHARVGSIVVAFVLVCVAATLA